MTFIQLPLSCFHSISYLVHNISSPRHTQVGDRELMIGYCRSVFFSFHTWSPRQGRVRKFNRRMNRTFAPLSSSIITIFLQIVIRDVPWYRYFSSESHGRLLCLPSACVHSSKTNAMTGLIHDENVMPTAFAKEDQTTKTMKPTKKTEKGRGTQRKRTTSIE